MKKIFLISIILIFSINLVAAQNTTNKIEVKPAELTETLKWYSPTEAFKLQKKHPKKIIMDVYTNWCGWCKRMDSQTFSDQKIIKYLNKNYYCVKFNAEGNDVVEWNGSTYVNDGKYGKSHSYAVTIMQGKMSYPTTVYFDEKGDLLTAVAGYLSPDDMMPVLRFFGTDAYKTKTFDAFKATE